MTFAFKYWNDDMSDGSGLLDCDNKKIKISYECQLLINLMLNDRIKKKY
jgi:hypothetical protein